MQPGTLLGLMQMQRGMRQKRLRTPPVTPPELRRMQPGMPQELLAYRAQKRMQPETLPGPLRMQPGTLPRPRQMQPEMLLGLLRMPRGTQPKPRRTQPERLPKLGRGM
ncbi:hypothetical protein D9M69_451700 [compost metagenome]